MSTAQNIVSILLEAGEVVRVCTGCQNEFGTQAAPNASHGYCRRHAIKMWQDEAQAHPSVAQLAQTNVAKIQQQPDSNFAPDMAQQRQAVPA
jgi:hypothetical protein